jgi:hypothetical protein
MEDGTRITTGDDGHYSVPQVMAGERVLRVDRGTLPTGSRLVAGGTAFSDDPISRFVTMAEGGIVRADFYLLAPAQASLGFSSNRDRLSSAGESAVARFYLRLDDPSTTQGVLLTDTLPAGLHYDLTTLAINGVATKVDGKLSRTLSVQLRSLVGAAGDTVTISIVADSAGIAMPIGRRGMLILSYPKGRDAIFRASDPSAAPHESHGSVMRYEPRRYFTDARRSGRETRGGR